jgi:hypothetical protein
MGHIYTHISDKMMSNLYVEIESMSNWRLTSEMTSVRTIANKTYGYWSKIEKGEFIR